MKDLISRESQIHVDVSYKMTVFITGRQSELSDAETDIFKAVPHTQTV